MHIVVSNIAPTIFALICRYIVYYHKRNMQTVTDLSGPGNVVGTAGKGVGDTINSATGTQAVGDGLKNLTGGVENAGNNLGKGAENVGQGKTS